MYFYQNGASYKIVSKTWTSWVILILTRFQEMWYNTSKPDYVSIISSITHICQRVFDLFVLGVQDILNEFDIISPKSHFRKSFRSQTLRHHNSAALNWIFCCRKLLLSSRNRPVFPNERPIIDQPDEVPICIYVRT